MFRDAAVQTRSRGLLGRAAGLHPAATDAAAAGRRGAGRAGARRRSPRRGRATRCTPSSARSPTPAWLSRARCAWTARSCSCETSGTARVERLDQRRGRRLRRDRRIRVAPWLSRCRRCSAARSSTSRTRCPTSYRLAARRARAAGGRARRRRRALLACGAAAGSTVSDGAAADAGARITTSRARRPRRARRRARARRGGGDGHRVTCTARSTTCCARTTRCSPTRTPRSGRRRCPGCSPRCAATGVADDRTARYRPRPPARVGPPPRSSAPASPASPPPTNWRSAASTSRSTSRATDERTELGAAASRARIPPVKLGGLAASQYSTPGPTGGSPAELRPFPGRRGQPRPPRRAVAGEHGFRFFPAYYLHIWDLLQRIPVYQPRRRPGGDAVLATDLTHGHGQRPAGDHPGHHGRRQAVARLPPRGAPQPRPSCSPRCRPARATSGFTASDVRPSSSRLLRYLVTSPLRRAAELQNLSAYDFFVGDDGTGSAPVHLHAHCSRRSSSTCPRSSPHSTCGGATPAPTSPPILQLQLQMDRRDSKADGVLNGPTTESWFDHWYRHLVALGVRFVRAAVDRLEPPAGRPVHATAPAAPGAVVVLADGTRLAPDYVVVAVDAARGRAHHRPRCARRAPAARWRGWTGSPPRSPHRTARCSRHRRGRRPAGSPTRLDEMGRVPWDRFQTLAGIQYYFDTEFQLVRGHVYYSGDGVGAVVDQPARTVGAAPDPGPRRPRLRALGRHRRFQHPVAAPARRARTGQGGPRLHGRRAGHGGVAADRREPHQRASTTSPEALVPLARVVRRRPEPGDGGGPGEGDGRPVRNEAPYLVPSSGDWPNRPGGEPWNPHGTSWIAPADRGPVARRPRASATSGRPATAATRCTTTRWCSPAPGRRRSPG